MYTEYQNSKVVCGYYVEVRRRGRKAAAAAAAAAAARNDRMASTQLLRVITHH